MDMENNMPAEIAGVSIADLTSIVNAGPAALTLNERLVTTANQIGNNLLDKIEANGGLNAELDQEANDLLVRYRQGLEKIAARRKPLTALFDAVRSAFTGLEKQMEATTVGSVPNRLQAHRNKYAAELKKEQDAAAQKVKAEQDRKNELIQVGEDIKKIMEEEFIRFKTGEQQRLNKIFSEVTLETFSLCMEALKTFAPSYPVSHFQGVKFADKITFRLNTKDDVLLVVKNIKTQAAFDEFNRRFNADLASLQRHLLDMMPGRKQELMDIQAAKATDKARLLADAAERERLRRKQADEAAEIELKKRQDQIAISADAQRLDALFTDAEVVVVPAGQVRKSLNIQIIKTAGWLEIINLYFQIEGVAKTPDWLEKKTLSYMKGVCEKHASKTGERISSHNLTYTEEVSVISK